MTKLANAKSKSSEAKANVAISLDEWKAAKEHESEQAKQAEKALTAAQAASQAAAAAQDSLLRAQSALKTAREEAHKSAAVKSHMSKDLGSKLHAYRKMKAEDAKLQRKAK